MLVRILSNIASFLGNARHRAILVSCLVLTFSTASVVGILAMHEEQTNNAATIDQAEASEDQKEDTIWLREQQVDNKDTLEEEAAEPTPQADSSKETPVNDIPEQPTPLAIELNVSDVTFAAGNLSSAINAGVAGDSSETPWDLTVISPNDDLTIANSQQSSDKIFTFQLQANSQAVPGKHIVTVQASSKDGKKLTATLTVNILAAEQTSL
jgi:hypothetical protein